MARVEIMDKIPESLLLIPDTLFLIPLYAYQGINTA